LGLIDDNIGRDGKMDQKAKTKKKATPKTKMGLAKMVYNPS